MKRLVAAAAVAAIALPALAQSTDSDWEIAQVPSEKAVVAFMQFSSGLTLAVRCVDGDYAVLMSGLPEAGRGVRNRMLRIAFQDHPATPWRWNVTTDRTAAIADYPAPFARMLREGGAFQVTIPDGAGPGRNLRHDLTLPPSGAAIDETLAACGRPAVDPRDALLPEIEDGGLPSGVTWARRPQPRFPSGSFYANGYAVLSCLTRSDGGMDACVIESQHPANGRFGEAALRGTREARIDSPHETAGAFRPRMIAFRTNFVQR